MARHGETRRGVYGMLGPRALPRGHGPVGRAGLCGGAGPGWAGPGRAGLGVPCLLQSLSPSLSPSAAGHLAAPPLPPRPLWCLVSPGRMRAVRVGSCGPRRTVPCHGRAGEPQRSGVFGNGHPGAGAVQSSWKLAVQALRSVRVPWLSGERRKEPEPGSTLGS